MRLIVPSGRLICGPRTLFSHSHMDGGVKENALSDRPHTNMSFCWYRISSMFQWQYNSQAEILIPRNRRSLVVVLAAGNCCICNAGRRRRGRNLCVQKSRRPTDRPTHDIQRGLTERVFCAKLVPNHSDHMDTQRQSPARKKTEQYVVVLVLGCCCCFCGSCVTIEWGIIFIYQEAETFVDSWDHV